MGTTSANDIAEGIRAMNTDLFALLLASGRAFTMLPNGSIQVPAANVNVKTPVKTFDNNAKDAKDSDKTFDNDVKTFDNSASDVKEKPLTNSLPQQPVRPAAPDTASNEATVKSSVKSDDVKENVKENLLTKPLTNDLQEVLTRFAGQGSVQISDVANAFDISRQLAQYRLRRLVELTDGLVTKGEHRGEYNFRTIPESAVGAGAEPHVDSDDAPKGATTLASIREEKGEPSNYSKSTTYGKSLGNNCQCQVFSKDHKSSDADQSQKHCPDCSDEYPRSHTSTIPPASATSPKPLAAPRIGRGQEEDEWADAAREAGYDEDDSQEEHDAPPSAPMRTKLPPYDPYAAARRRREMEQRGYIEENDDDPMNGYDPPD